MTAEVQRERFSPSHNEITLLSLKLLADQNESGDYVPPKRPAPKPLHRSSSHNRSDPFPFEPQPPTPKQPLLLPPLVASNANDMKPQKAELSNADPPLESGRWQVPRPSIYLNTLWNTDAKVRSREVHRHTLTCTRLCVYASVCVRLCTCQCVYVSLCTLLHAGTRVSIRQHRVL